MLACLAPNLGLGTTTTSSSLASSSSSASLVAYADTQSAREQIKFEEGAARGGGKVKHTQKMTKKGWKNDSFGTSKLCINRQLNFPPKITFNAPILCSRYLAVGTQGLPIPRFDCCYFILTVGPKGEMYERGKVFAEKFVLSKKSKNMIGMLKSFFCRPDKKEFLVTMDLPR